MTTGSRVAILGAVRRARRRLELLRLLKTTARGVVCGAVAGTLLGLVFKLWPGMGGLGNLLAWSLTAAGALGGLVRGLFSRGVELAAAALFLDDRLKTRQGIVTLLTCSEGRFLPRVERAVGAVGKLPRMPFPHEAGWLPAAFFLLFAGGLVPARGAKEPPAELRWVAAPAAAEDLEAEPAPAPIPSAVLQRLAAGKAPGAPEAARLQAVIDRRIARPEDRRAAREALRGALAGEGQAARALARALQSQGGSGTAPAPAERAAAAARGPEGAAVSWAEIYPEARDYLRRYRAALAEEEGK